MRSAESACLTAVHSVDDLDAVLAEVVDMFLRLAAGGLDDPACRPR
jgi:hypothetical protein